MNRPFARRASWPRQRRCARRLDPQFDLVKNRRRAGDFARGAQDFSRTEINSSAALM
jgi:hypothetical protein